MKGILIIQKDHGAEDMNYGPEHMMNLLYICDCILKDKSDGDDVEVTVTGKLIDQEGHRFISVHQVDGKDVEEMDGDAQEGPNLEMDSEDALSHFMNSVNKG